MDASLNIYIGQTATIAIIGYASQSTATSFIGDTSTGNKDGTGTSAKFNGIYAMVFDSSYSNIYLCDSGSGNMRKVTVSDATSTLFYGSGGCNSLAFDQAYTYLYTSLNNNIYKIEVSTVDVILYAGVSDGMRLSVIFYIICLMVFDSGLTGFTDGTLTIAKFNSPYGLYLDSSGNILVADVSNNAIRLINVGSSTVTTVLGTSATGSTDGSSSSATFNGPSGVILMDGSIYVTDYYSNKIRKISCQSGTGCIICGPV